MNVMQVARAAACAVVLPAILAAASPPPAGGVSVSPIRLELGADAPRGVLTVANDSQAPARVEVTGLAWDDSVDGRTTLTPSTALVVYPTIFSLQPGATQTLRIGLVGEPTGAERTFRVEIKQLSVTPLRVGADSSALGIQTRLSVPIFIEPTEPRRQLQLSDAALRGRMLSLHVRDTGNAYDFVSSISATALDASGSPIFTARGSGWYVLAGHDRIFRLIVPAGSCSAARSVKIAVLSEWGGAVATLPLTGSCQ